MIGSFTTTMCPLMYHISCRVLWWNIKSLGWLSSSTAQILCHGTSGFSQIKITFEKEGISGYQWDSGKYKGAADVIWKNYVRSQGAYFEKDWGIIVLCSKFLVSSSINVYFFIVHCWILSGQASCTHMDMLVSEKKSCRMIHSSWCYVSHLNKTRNISLSLFRYVNA